MTDAPTRSDSSLYRILAFHRVVQLFESKTLHFSHPSTWQDPFETHLRHRAVDRLFAQCWCKKGVSDAMWRIYSPDALGVRIRTTQERLDAALSNKSAEAGFSYKIRRVRYLPERELKCEIEAVASKLAQSFSIDRARSPLFLKRQAFRHEAEVRAVVYIKRQQSGAPRDGVKITVDPHALIQSVLVDPRAPDEYVDAYRHYLRDCLGFTGRVAKSELYADREPVEVM